MYILSCSKCKREYIFKGLFAKRKRERFKPYCPNCFNLLMNGPLFHDKHSIKEIKRLEVEKGFFRL